jgi:alkylation response protein AidB-like acyl-CoA dehydrogenase
VTGDIVAAWCFKDGGGSWVPGEFAVTAVREEGGYRLNGVKSMVEAAPQADVLLITASAPSGPSQFLVDVGTPGVAIIPTEGLDLVRRFGDVHLVDVVVPESGLVGSEGGASSTIARQLDLASVLLSASMVGAAERVFEFTVQYAFSRYSFGRPLASYQALKHRFADMFLWLEACEATMQAAAKALDSDSAFESNTPSIAKAFVAEYAPEIIQGCVQLHGAIGVTWEHNLHLFLRRVTLDRGLYGGPDIHQDAVGAMVVGPHV